MTKHYLGPAFISVVNRHHPNHWPCPGRESGSANQILHRAQSTGYGPFVDPFDHSVPIATKNNILNMINDQSGSLDENLEKVVYFH